MTTWNPGDRAIATVRGVADVEVVRTDDPDLPWHSDERVPDYFGPQTEHAERMVRDLRPLHDDPPEGWGHRIPDRAPAPDRIVHNFSALYDTGLLWYINRTILNPRGYALALEGPDDNPAGWTLHYAGAPVTFDLPGGEMGRFAAVDRLLAEAREHGVSPAEGAPFFKVDAQVSGLTRWRLTPRRGDLWLILRCALTGHRWEFNPRRTQRVCYRCWTVDDLMDGQS